MALVVFLRGVNVGGHRTFRPSALAKELKDLEATNIGAAGTFVIGRRVSRAQLRVEFARRLPFETQMAICESREIARLASRDFFQAGVGGPDVVGFVSILCGSPRSAVPIPMRLPATGTWLVRILAKEGRFVVGMYRRHMKAIGYLGRLDRMFGVPVTTRNWTTVMAVARALNGPAS